MHGSGSVKEELWLQESPPARFTGAAGQRIVRYSPHHRSLPSPLVQDCVPCPGPVKKMPLGGPASSGRGSPGGQVHRQEA